MVNIIMDIIFPQHACCICRKPGRFGTRHPWCSECVDHMEQISRSMPICDKCGKYLEKGEGLCHDCREKMPDFDICRSVGPYTDTFRIVAKVLKFMCKKNLAFRMGAMMAQVVKEEERFWPLDLILPVPSSQGSLKQRGFSQTELLGHQISRILKIKMLTDVLLRVKDTPHQRDLTREEREKNLLCAFEIKDIKKVYRKNILLVDDIYTTGSTIRECTKMLLEAGAARVAVVTWASGIGY